MKPESLNSARAPEPVGAYPHVKRAGDLLFLSGVGPREKGSKAIPSEFHDQCLAVFRNVRMILEDCGSNWESIVDVTVFLTDMKKDFPVFNALYAEHFKTNQPSRTTVGVTHLPTLIAIELKVIATV